MNILLNFAIYQAIWFLCILGGNIGAGISLLLLLIHLALTNQFKADLELMIILLVAGIIIDGSLHHFGQITFTSHAFPIPFWLAVIWVGLATLPHHSLAWLKGKPLLACILGGIAGPLAYWAGVRIGVAEFTGSLLSSLTLFAIVWAIGWPLAMQLAAKMVPRQKKESA